MDSGNPPSLSTVDGKLRRMQEGVYESVLTSGLLSQLDAVTDLEAEIARVDPADQTHVLARHLASAIQSRLAAERDPDQRLILANSLLRTIQVERASVEHPVRELHGLRRPPAPGRTVRFQRRPKTPLNDAALLTNAHGEPSLASELGPRSTPPTRVDLLCAFVKWHGSAAARRRARPHARRAGVRSA